MNYNAGELEDDSEPSVDNKLEPDEFHSLATDKNQFTKTMVPVNAHESNQPNESELQSNLKNEVEKFNQLKNTHISLANTDENIINKLVSQIPMFITQEMQRQNLNIAFVELDNMDLK